MFFPLLFVCLSCHFSLVLCDFRLVSAVELFRHGARTSIKVVDDKEWIYDWGPGELTPVGYREQFLLGKQIRENYEEIIDPSQKNNEFYVVSGGGDRMIQSAVAQILGIFSKEGALDGDEDSSFPFGLLPIHSTNKEYDFLFEPYLSCKRASNHIASSFASSKYIEMQDAFREAIDEVQELFSSVQKYTSGSLSLSQASDLVDFAITETWNGRGNYIPLNSAIWEKGLLLIHASMYWMVEKEWVRKAFVTEIFKVVIGNFESFVAKEEKSKVKVTLLSGHDLNILFVLAALGLGSWDCILQKYQEENYAFNTSCIHNVTYASNIFFELWEDSSASSSQIYYARVLFNGWALDVCGDPIGEEKYCEWEDLKSNLEGLMVDLDEECPDDNQSEIFLPSGPGTIVNIGLSYKKFITGAFLIIIANIVILLVLTGWKNRLKEKLEMVFADQNAFSKKVREELELNRITPEAQEKQDSEPKLSL